MSYYYRGGLSKNLEIIRCIQCQRDDDLIINNPESPILELECLECGTLMQMNTEIYTQAEAFKELEDAKPSA